MVVASGRLYVGNGNRLLALDNQGQLVWNFRKSDGLQSMAERPDGSVLLTGSRTLTAISAQGQTLWDADIHVHHSLDPNGFTRVPTLAVDNAGTAHVGTADGRVVVIDRTGRITARVPAGGYHDGFTPLVMLGPSHTLVASGNDSVVRVYQ